MTSERQKSTWGLEYFKLRQTIDDEEARRLLDIAALDLARLEQEVGSQRAAELFEELVRLAREFPPEEEAR